MDSFSACALSHVQNCTFQCLYSHSLSRSFSSGSDVLWTQYQIPLWLRQHDMEHFLHVVQACIIVNVLLVHQNCCWDLEYHIHHDCLQAKSILMHWYSSIKLAVYTFLLHSIYLHALHITSYLINLMFISCYHLSSCTHNTLYILTLQ